MNDKFKRQFDRFKVEATSLITHNAPYRTGELRRSIKRVDIPNGFQIIIDVDHMKYTEEEWTYNKRWGKTLTNKNQYWLRDSTYNLAERFARKLKGVVK